MDSHAYMHEDERLTLVEFPLRVRARVKAVLEEGQARWDEIVRNCDGAYPDDVHEQLCWLIDNREVVRGPDSTYRLAWDCAPLVPNAARTREVRSIFASVLPEPHPADFDWRFTQDAIEVLLGQIDSLASRQDEIAILGAPTLFMALADCGFKVWLFDKNACLLGNLHNAGYRNLVHHDLFCKVPFYNKFEIAVADPPWYPEHYQAFVGSAGVLLRSAGHLLLSVLPALTRPAAVADRAALSELTDQYGFLEIARRARTLLYECPRFEMAALKHRSLYCGPWRFGDLVVYKLAQDNDGIDHAPLQTEDETSWRTFTLRRLVVKVRCRQPEDGATFDFHPVSGDGVATLATVSRRDPRRSHIDLWTSRNSAFSVSRLEILPEMLQQLECGNGDPMTTVCQKYRINQLEMARVNDLIGWLATESRD